jgi:hypothetical protein
MAGCGCAAEPSLEIVEEAADGPVDVFFGLLFCVI